MDDTQLREILPDVFTWQWFSERHGYDFNGYLFRHPSGNVAVDPVEVPDPVLDELARLGVARIAITNRNHTRDSRRLRERSAARVAIHPADAAHATAQGAAIDDELPVGERVGPFVVLGAEGKSPGEVALHWPQRRILVVGDACVGKPPGACALLPESVMDDPAALRKSLTRLARTVDFDVLLVGDGAPILTGGRAALEKLVATFA
jgi:glyoxylase-like metal-dependent hydrolase (beta-lactamase superfamily II)